jgi:hypothetical protein
MLKVLTLGLYLFHGGDKGLDFFKDLFYECLKSGIINSLLFGVMAAVN